MTDYDARRQIAALKRDVDRHDRTIGDLLAALLIIQDLLTLHDKHINNLEQGKETDR